MQGLRETGPKAWHKKPRPFGDRGNRDAAIAAWGGKISCGLMRP